ncbi:SH3 domain-containing protein [Moraxella boevrei]|uniref:SH3 domain-containing protein n=1 Tax=Faucicola boevrei TaxID=346665 RepID=UPI0037363AA4
MKFKALLTITGIALATTLPISAFAKTCLVADSSGTPLKYRSAPYGKVLGTLKNGTYVYITEWKYDSNGKPWVRAFRHSDDKYLGWVYYDYLSCNE